MFNRLSSRRTWAFFTDKETLYVLGNFIKFFANFAPLYPIDAIITLLHGLDKLSKGDIEHEKSVCKAEHGK